MDAADEQERSRVLVVDDDPDVRRALKSSLRRIGCEVLDAGSGEEGLELVMKEKPQVVFLDIWMPKMDGHTFLRRLASLDTDSAVVVISAHGTMEDVVDILRNGAVDYLAKPWTASELVGALGRAIEINDARRLRRAAESVPPSAIPSEPEQPPQVTAPKANPAYDRVLEQVRGGEVLIPALPGVVTQLRTMLGAPGVSMAQLAALIERDPALSAQMLRLAQSASYLGMRSGSTPDLRGAVNRLGLRQIQSLVETALLRGVFAPQEALLRGLHARIWPYSVARAVVMRALAAAAALPEQLDPEVAYLAGLFADVGALLLLWVIHQRTSNGTAPLDEEATLAVLRAHHGPVGEELLRRWGLPAAAATIARAHHAAEPPGPPEPPSLYWHLSVLGTAVADALTGGDDPTRAGPLDAELVERCRDELRIGASVVDKVRESARPELQRILSALR
jgi:HD-like signal output (HDOD) protein/DNA-binding NarL/FixJ family response regulator